MSKLLRESVNNFFGRLGYRLSRIDRTDHFFDMEALLHFQLRKSDGFFFVQIGACDGISFDPIYRFVTRNHEKIRGIVVEPLNDYFKELQHNYKKYPGIIPVRSAIHNVKKEMILYRVDPSKIPALPKWAKGISSFNKDHHRLSGTSSDHIIQEKVPCMSLAELFDEYHVQKIDLLQIDTEGYDAEIMLNLDLNHIKPKIIRFEHGLPHGIMQKEQFLQIIDVLHRNDYEVALDKYDATAYQRSIILD